MKNLIDMIAAIILGAVLLGMKYFIGFENTVCIVSAMALVEFWRLNSKL